MFVISRFRVPDGGSEEQSFRSDAEAALEALSRRPGYVDGRLGRNLDDPSVWALSTTWADVGSYRRALSSYDVKVGAVPLLARAVDEPSAYEEVEPGRPTNDARARDLR